MKGLYLSSWFQNSANVQPAGCNTAFCRNPKNIDKQEKIFLIKTINKP